MHGEAVLKRVSGPCGRAEAQAVKGTGPDTPIFCDKENGLSAEDGLESCSPESELVGGSDS